MKTCYFDDLIALMYHYNGAVHGILHYFYLFKNEINESNLIFKGSIPELMDKINPKNSEIFYYTVTGEIKEWFIDDNKVVVVLVR